MTKTIAEIVRESFPHRVYHCPDAPEDKRYLVMISNNPPKNTLHMPCYGADPDAALAAGRATIVKVLTALRPDGRKTKAKYMDTPEGRLSEALDELMEIISPFLPEITSE